MRSLLLRTRRSGPSGPNTRWRQGTSCLSFSDSGGGHTRANGPAAVQSGPQTRGQVRQGGAAGSAVGRRHAEGGGDAPGKIQYRPCCLYLR